MHEEHFHALNYTVCICGFRGFLCTLSLPQTKKGILLIGKEMKGPLPLIHCLRDFNMNDLK